MRKTEMFFTWIHSDSDDQLFNFNFLRLHLMYLFAAECVSTFIACL
jgi:hypothetical protein